MKNLTLLLIVLLSLSVSSCKKTYTCACTFTISVIGGSASAPKTADYPITATHSDAVTQCNDENNNLQQQYNISGVQTISSSCTI
jgi:hypothetical protein